MAVTGSRAHNKHTEARNTNTHTHTHMVKAPHLVLISQIVVRFALFGLSQWNYL